MPRWTSTRPSGYRKTLSYVCLPPEEHTLVVAVLDTYASGESPGMSGDFDMPGRFSFTPHVHLVAARGVTCDPSMGSPGGPRSTLDTRTHSSRNAVLRWPTRAYQP